MTLAAAPAQSQEFAFSDADFDRIAVLARRDFGLSLSSSKKPLVYSRLAKRLRFKNVPSFRDYLDLLESGRDDPERLELLSALTTNVTHFFRETHHFDLLRQEILPGLIARARAGGRVRLWSAGCSTGQEPYSLAMTVLDMLPDATRHDIKILATDIDPVVVDRARAATYPVDELDGIPQTLRKIGVLALEAGARTFEIAPTIRQLVTFGTLNLIGPWPVKGPFDVIFCRNVAIYFDQDTQRQLWAGFGAVLAPDAALMIGHSERLSDSLSGHFKTIGVTAYRRLGGTHIHDQRGTA